MKNFLRCITIVCLIVNSLNFSIQSRVANKLNFKLLKMNSENQEAQAHPPQVAENARNAQLLAKAQLLRAEAAELEAEQKVIIAESIYETFKFFDTDKSGTVTVEELREGLKKTIKLSLTEKQAEELLKAFDESGDGVLQPNEFKSVEDFKNKFELFVRKEKEEANAARLAARLEKKSAEEAEQRALMISELLNDRNPTLSDRFLSVLPYLFPLLDVTSYGQDVLKSLPPNFFASLLLLAFRVYINIPLSGIVAFFALNFLSQNLQLNRLIRFNIRQAIFIDIALIFPSLITSVFGVILPEIGVILPSDFNKEISALVFISFSLAIVYSVISSILGITPDKLPYISERVEKVYYIYN